MIQIPMTAQEFAAIEAGLQHLNPAEGIALHLADVATPNPNKGNIVGTHPFGWSADFTYDQKELTVIGHGNHLLGVPGRVEAGIQSRLDAALAMMRQKVGG